MEKKKTIRTMRNTDVVRIPKSQSKTLKKIGDGNIRIGLTKTITIYEQMTSNPERILMQDVEQLMNDLQKHYSANHYNHFDNFPAFFRVFLKRGIPDIGILTGKHSVEVDEVETGEDSSYK